MTKRLGNPGNRAARALSKVRTSEIQYLRRLEKFKEKIRTLPFVRCENCNRIKYSPGEPHVLDRFFDSKFHHSDEYCNLMAKYAHNVDAANSKFMYVANSDLRRLSDSELLSTVSHGNDGTIYDGVLMSIIDQLSDVSPSIRTMDVPAIIMYLLSNNKHHYEHIIFTLGNSSQSAILISKNVANVLMMCMTMRDGKISVYDTSEIDAVRTRVDMMLGTED